MFLDLEEALVELGYSDVFDRREASLRIVFHHSEYRNEKYRKRKRDEARARYARTKGPPKKRGPKPRFTAEQRRERNIAGQRARRQKKERERMERNQTALLGFILRLEETEMVTQARLAAIGRELEEEGKVGVPSIALLFLGQNQDAEAARIDLMYFLRHSLWSIEKIAWLFDYNPEYVNECLRLRTVR